MYIIKKHYEATESNLKFAGDVKDWYEGQNGFLIGGNGFPTKSEINAFGYNTLAGAKRGLKKAEELAKWETEKGHWKVTVELIKC